MTITPRSKLLIGSIAMFSSFGGWWAFTEGPLRDPQAALRDFYAPVGRAEDQLADPLILNGHKVVPLVVADVKNKAMPLRRYAIGFLGIGRYSEALPVLVSILNDETELFYFRADALIAIYQISPSQAKELAPRHVAGEELLGHIAKQIVGGVAKDSTLFERRSWWKAFFSVHE